MQFKKGVNKEKRRGYKTANHGCFLFPSMPACHQLIALLVNRNWVIMVHITAFFLTPVGAIISI